jgi:hypothetical protein
MNENIRMEKSMKITEQWLIEHKACVPAIKAFNKQKRLCLFDSDEILDYLIKKRLFAWALWLVAELLPEEVYYSEYADNCIKVLNSVGKKSEAFKVIAQYGKDLLKKIEKGEKCTY